MSVLFFYKVMTSSRLNAFEFPAVLYNHPPVLCSLYTASCTAERRRSPSLLQY